MCLGIPGQVKEIRENNIADVDFAGITRPVNLSLVPEAKVGDFVIVHVGVALSRIDEKEANRVLSFLTENPDIQ